MIELIPNWHPLWVHFTVALLSLAVVLHGLTLLPLPSVLRAEWKVVARWLLWLGALFAIATAISGWLAYNSVEHDDVSHAAMTEHRNWALITLGVFVLAALWSIGRKLKPRPGEGGAASLIFSLALVAGAILLAGTAWRGGELVYRHGLGVMSMPNKATPAPAPQSQPPTHDHSTHQH